MVVRLAAVAVLLALSTLVYYWWTSRQGVVKRVVVPGALTPDEIGGSLGMRATFVQFSTPMCAKCPGTKALLLEIAAEQPHVAHVEVDASERLDLARELNIMRTPTTLVVDSDGVVVARMDGAMTREQAREALNAAPPVQDYTI